MCGICGIIGGRDASVSLNKLQAMNDLAIHRGPDDKGFAVFALDGECNVASNVREFNINKNYSVGLGHKRLSIIDLSQNAHQPMFDQTKRYCIVYNGELYNYPELRKDLQALDIQFHSTSDTEVILSAYIKWGVDCLRKFNGMWSFAIYDRKNKTLFCSRDNFGIKPFYYIYRDNYFVFSSEIKQIVECFDGKTNINEKILSDFLFWGYETHTNDTFFRDIHSLPPSHYLMIEISNMKESSFTPKKYWQPEFDNVVSDTRAIEQFKEIFIDSVNIRLRSDVPIGMTLSGGLDSSSIACVIDNLIGDNNESVAPKLFTSIYSDLGFSEKPFADAVVEKTGFQHVCVYPSALDLKNHWKNIIWHIEEPFGSLTYFSNWNVYKKCQEEGIPVILNGQGGDELLLGYERYRAAYFKTLLKALKFNKVISEFNLIKKNANMSFSKQLLNLMYFTFPIFKSYRNSSLVRPYLMNDFYRSHRHNILSVEDEMDNRDLIEMQLKEFFKYQLQHLLHHEDRISMAFSIEARLPFLDYRLFNFVLGLDDSLKLNSGWSKYILRQALDGYLPDIIKNRTDKMGFDTPGNRLIYDNKDFFIDIFMRNINDKYINVKNVMNDFNNKGINESLLCRIITFLSWKETFQIN